MKASAGKRFFAFFFQLIFWLPFSAIINTCAIAPFLFLSELNKENGMPLGNVIIFTLLFWAIAFGLSKLRQRIKGRETDEYYDVVYDEVTSYYYDDVKIAEVHRDVYKTESKNTFWGWVGIILSFIALPLQIIALIASFLGMFVPVIYSTTKKLPEDRDFSFGNILLHSLFEFVIIPVSYKRKGTPNAKGLLFLLFYILTPIIIIALGFLGALIIKDAFLIDYNLVFVSIISIVILFFVILSIIVCIVKYSILIIYDYDVDEGKKYLFKLIGLSIFAALLLIASFCFL